MPTPEPTNADRSRWADDAVLVHAAATRSEGEDAETKLSDLLANLRHWADDVGLDFDKASLRGEAHYLAEVEESPEDQIDRLASFMLEEVPGEPSQEQSVVETAIRLIRDGQELAAWWKPHSAAMGAWGERWRRFLIGSGDPADMSEGQLRKFEEHRVDFARQAVELIEALDDEWWQEDPNAEQEEPSSKAPVIGDDIDVW